MESRVPVRAAALLVAVLAASAGRDVAAGPVPGFDPRADAAAEIDAALVRAQRGNRRVLVVWGADWCPWSRAFLDLLAQDVPLRKEMASAYEITRVDVGRFDRNQDLFLAYGHDLSRARIPVLTILDAAGNLFASEDAHPLEARSGRRMGYDPAKVLELLARYEGPPKDADAVYAAAFEAAISERKRIFIHFGATLRPACERLERWLDSPSVASVLAKDFVIVKIDVERMPGARSLLGRLRESEDASLPWFAILDAEGRPLVTSDAGGCRNIRFPQAPDEIDHFGTMLRKGALRLWKSDIDGLLASLRELRAKEKAAQAEAKKPPAAKGEDGEDKPVD